MVRDMPVVKSKGFAGSLRQLAEGRVTPSELLRDLREDDLIEILVPKFANIDSISALAIGDGVLAGDVTGQLILNRTLGEWIIAEAKAKQTEVDVIYSTPYGDLEDFAVLRASRGFFTSHTGRTTFCPVQANCEGIPTVVGVNCQYIEYSGTHRIRFNCRNNTVIEIEQPIRVIRFPDGREIREGEYISLSGKLGALYEGELEVIQPLIARVYHVLTDALLEAVNRFGPVNAETRISDTETVAQEHDWLVEAIQSPEFRGFQQLLHTAHDIAELKVFGTIHTGRGMAQALLYGSHIDVDLHGRIIVRHHPSKYGLGLLRDERMWSTQESIDLQRILMLGEELVGGDYGKWRSAYLAQFVNLLKETFQVGVGQVAVVRLLCVPFKMLFSDNFDVKRFSKKFNLDPEAVANRVKVLSSERETYHGCRGVRITVQREDICELWCEGVLRAAKDAADQGKLSDLQILLSMVTLPQEVQNFIDVFERKLAELNLENEPWIRGISVMIETSGTFHVLEDIISLFGKKVKVNGALFGGNDFTAACLNMNRSDSGTLIIPNYVRLGFMPTNPFQSINVQVVGKVILQALRRIRTTARYTNQDYLVGLGGEIAGDWDTVQWLAQNATVYGLKYVSTAPERILFSLLASAQVAQGDY